MAMGTEILRWLLALDRRVVFFLVAAAVAFPLILPLNMPVHVSQPVKQLYDAVEKLPAEGEPVIVAIDFDPSTVPELRPMAVAVLHHLFKKRVPFLLLTLHPAGQGIAQDIVDTVKLDYPNVIYGKDYAFMGFAVGYSLVILGIGQDFAKTFPKDAYGTPVSEIPVTKNVKNFEDIAMVIDFAASAVFESWIMFAYQKHGCKVGAGVTAVMATDAYPFLQAGQLDGLLGGLSGAAEYEVLVKEPGSAKAGMDAQSVVHLLIIFLIILGNIAYFGTRRKTVAAGSPTEDEAEA